MSELRYPEYLLEQIQADVAGGEADEHTKDLCYALYCRQWFEAEEDVPWGRYPEALDYYVEVEVQLSRAMMEK